MSRDEPHMWDSETRTECGRCGCIRVYKQVGVRNVRRGCIGRTRQVPNMKWVYTWPSEPGELIQHTAYDNKVPPCRGGA